jgi:hypothetical protein
MSYLSKLVLNCSPGCYDRLEPFVERCLRDGVKFIAVAGERCDFIEDVIDELVVGKGLDESRFILTSSHPGEPLDEVVRFVASLTGDYEGEVEVVEL